MTKENIKVIEEEYPYPTREDINGGALAKFSEWNGGSYALVTDEEFRNKLSLPSQGEGVVIKPHLVTELPERLVRESQIPRIFKSPKILLNLKEKGITKEQSDEIDYESILSDWKHLLGIFYRIYDDEDAGKIFLFLTDVLKKKNLYDTFSILTTGPKRITDADTKKNLFILKSTYGLVESEEDLWYPKRYSPLEQTRNLKRICKRGNAPKELIRILDRYKMEFIEDRERIRKVSEVIIYSKPIDYRGLLTIDKFLKERGLDPNDRVLELSKSERSKPYLPSLFCPSIYEYSFRCRGLTYGIAEELLSLLEDEFPVTNVHIALK